MTAIVSQFHAVLLLIIPYRLSTDIVIAASVFLCLHCISYHYVCNCSLALCRVPLLIVSETCEVSQLVILCHGFACWFCLLRTAYECKSSLVSSLISFFQWRHFITSVWVFIIILKMKACPIIWAILLTRCSSFRCILCFINQICCDFTDFVGIGSDRLTNVSDWMTNVNVLWKIVVHHEPSYMACLFYAN